MSEMGILEKRKKRKTQTTNPERAITFMFSLNLITPNDENYT